MKEIKRFLKRVILFFVFLLVINIILNVFLFTKSKYPVNEVYVKKKKYLLNNNHRYNTIFFGSSRIYRQVNPRIINDCLKEYNISSFNLAAPATFNPELYTLYEELIKSKDLKIKYAFLEITDLNVIALKNLFSIRTYYLADWDYLIYSFSYITDSNRPMIERIYLYMTYGASFILNKILPPDYSTITNNPSPDPIKPYGYYSLNEELNTGKKKEIEFIMNRHMRFNNDTSELGSRIKSAKRAFSQDREIKIINQTHIDRLNELLKLSNDYNIQLYFIIPPLHKDYDEIADLRMSFPENRVIVLANYEKYPEIYRSNNLFDIGHLNSKGSDLLSRNISREFKIILDNDH